MTEKTDRNPNENPLEELFTDATGLIDRTDLLTVLKPYVQINRKSKRLFYTPDGLKLSAIKRVALFVLSQKALLSVGVADSESVTPKEIKDGLGRSTTANTVGVAIKRLSDRGLLRNEEGKYFVPESSFPKLREMLQIN